MKRVTIWNHPDFAQPMVCRGTKKQTLPEALKWCPRRSRNKLTGRCTLMSERRLKSLPEADPI